MSFNHYYERELTALRHLGKRFSERSPALAQFLGQAWRDLDVERLLEVSGENGRSVDHIDLWNKNELASIGIVFTFIRQTFSRVSEHLPYVSMSDLRRSSEVLFWEIE
ncbi:type VI secretion system baseplate subunit TssF [Pseudomonas sp. 5P_3.1_Bac2]|nr:type VI secretion system baseplate subunit TssF [Pseudomonas sp. 5P_3.1_Bac2]MCU1718965.1 type VI secretion system baseplate subunit TssF [Pseudomonas sp. 5P_3.1_Bac2]